MVSKCDPGVTEWVPGGMNTGSENPRTWELIEVVLRLARVQTGDAVSRCDDVLVAHQGPPTKLVAILTQSWMAIKFKTRKKG